MIADSSLFFRRGLRALLTAESDFDVIDESASAADVLAKLPLLQPDVLIMDVALLGTADSPAAFTLRQSHPLLSILFLTLSDSKAQFETAIAAGGRGYMLKTSDPSSLLAGVRQVASSDDSNPGGLSKIVPELRALASSNEKSKTSTALTAREQEVVRMLADGMTVRELASELGLSIKTVEAHKLNLMRKLDIHNRTDLVQYAVQHGLAERPEPAFAF